MVELTPRARQLVQLLAEELDRTMLSWAVFMEGDGMRGSDVWDWSVELCDDEETEAYESNAETNRADVIPIGRLR